MSKDLPQELAPFFDALGQRKARGLVGLDVRGISSVADFMVICSGLSNRQVAAMAEHVERHMKKRRQKALGVEGKTEGQWVLLDYGDVIVHIFHDSARDFYDLEGLWADAKRYYPKGRPENEEEVFND
ncbi:ribosome-associated protein [Desulfatibacillum alkenivorans DSM 16219]|jgi:ribosome-associated protein|uniref:Ribosomal silencing factor RsfS n=1 Tax=Desulfatibacillum alkenivorans DSM 16219 TaxID=1121393 RepID=A0A1M6SC22_9BACT|nr:ribosome silencing factor [Desulfatibacillum alkenivorans]SHK42304.1 ribosome-associated protein [Desulfatibacillum alkenivorans DSM 16219]